MFKVIGDGTKMDLGRLERGWRLGRLTLPTKLVWARAQRQETTKSTNPKQAA
jgi:hypothetical protein